MSLPVLDVVELGAEQEQVRRCAAEHVGAFVGRSFEPRRIYARKRAGANVTRLLQRIDVVNLVIREQNDEVGLPIQVQRQITGVKVRTRRTAARRVPIVVKLVELRYSRVRLIAYFNKRCIPKRIMGNPRSENTNQIKRLKSSLPTLSITAIGVEFVRKA